jgi:hypothetical protein
MRRAIAGAPAFAAALALASPARAVEHEHHLGADLGGAVLVVKDKGSSDIGGSLGVHYAYGLSDAFNLMIEGSYSLLALHQDLDSPKTPRTFPAQAGSAGVGLGYVFDVLQWVPYAGVLAGGTVFWGGTIDGATVLGDATVAIGLDYRVTTGTSVGIALRQHFLTDPTTYPSFTQAFARFETTWGW